MRYVPHFAFFQNGKNAMQNGVFDAKWGNAKWGI